MALRLSGSVGIATWTLPNVSHSPSDDEDDPSSAEASTSTSPTATTSGVSPKATAKVTAHVLRRDASAESPNSSASRIAVGSPVQLKADVDLAWSLIARFGEDPDEEDDPSDATIDLLWRVLMRRATKTESTANARVDQTTIDVDGIGMGAAEPARAASSPFHVSDTAQAVTFGEAVEER
ncbi:hypothetical protein ATCC90586_011175 [Pythium insidiosum]|nr:hypothetical protein ATCC90586_011175 [Pythium insidiosum]